jgi:hypothetical protein
MNLELLITNEELILQAWLGVVVGRIWLAGRPFDHTVLGHEPDSTVSTDTSPLATQLGFHYYLLFYLLFTYS